ncbi:MAG: MotA/TolQ/ExbB proton channel family protein, partial [Candidatus Omnitrophica bacterium]|nr:MotA/TolQ/ExbB proton channel family protein [Candidatus Omnitrophota bacterium]
MWVFIVKGGPLMGLIMLCSILALGIFIERMWHLYRARIDTDQFLEDIAALIKRNRIMEAIDKCNTTPGPVAKIMKMGLLKHDRTREEIRESILD